MSLHGLKILVVDDEKDLCELVAIIIENLGARVTRAFSGEEASQALDNFDYDLVLSDVRMPNIDGFYLLKKVRQELGLDIPFLMMTGYSNVSEDEARKLGATKVLKKPFDANRLTQVLQEALRNK